MKTETNILLTSAGRRTYLIEYFKEAVAGEGRVHAANSQICPAFAAADQWVITPLIYDENYGCALVDLIGEQPPLVQSEVRDSIREGILADDRFESVTFTEEKLQRGKLYLSLTVTCVDGEEIEVEEVEIDV